MIQKFPSYFLLSVGQLHSMICKNELLFLDFATIKDVERQRVYVFLMAKSEKGNEFINTVKHSVWRKTFPTRWLSCDVTCV